MVSNVILLYVKGFAWVNSRLCLLKLERHFWGIVAINGYVLTEEGNNDIKCKFYGEIENVYDTFYSENA